MSHPEVLASTVVANRGYGVDGLVSRNVRAADPGTRFNPRVVDALAALSARGVLALGDDDLPAAA